MRLNVAKLGCDFLVGSGESLHGPSSIAFLYVKKPILEALPPFLTGNVERPKETRIYRRLSIVAS